MGFINGVYFYFVNKLYLVGRHWDFKGKAVHSKTMSEKKQLLHVFFFFQPTVLFPHFLSFVSCLSNNDTLIRRAPPGWLSGERLGLTT